MQIIIKTATILIILATFVFATQSAQADTHKYDELGRLIETTYDSGRTVRYSYDSLGNMPWVEAEGTGELPDTFVITVTTGEGGATLGWCSGMGWHSGNRAQGY